MQASAGGEGPRTAVAWFPRQTPSTTCSSQEVHGSSILSVCGNAGPQHALVHKILLHGQPKLSLWQLLLGKAQHRSSQPH